MHLAAACELGWSPLMMVLVMHLVMLVLMVHLVVSAHLLAVRSTGWSTACCSVHVADGRCVRGGTHLARLVARRADTLLRCGVLVRVPVNGVVMSGTTWMVDTLRVLVAMRRIIKLAHDILLHVAAAHHLGPIGASSPI